MIWFQIYMVLFAFYCRVKKSLPERYQRRPETSLATALVSATLATLMCYPLDTVRRQMQMKGSPYNTILDAFPGKLPIFPHECCGSPKATLAQVCN